MISSINVIIQRSLRLISIPLRLTSDFVSRWGVVANRDFQVLPLVSIPRPIPCNYLLKTSHTRGKSRWIFRPGQFKGPQCVFVLIVNGYLPYVWCDATWYDFIKYKFPSRVISIPWKHILIHLPPWQHAVQTLVCDCSFGVISRCDVDRRCFGLLRNDSDNDLPDQFRR